jgi:hypothetical protein
VGAAIATRAAGDIAAQWISKQAAAIHRLLESGCTFPDAGSPPDENLVRPLEEALAALDSAAKAARSAAGSP